MLLTDRRTGYPSVDKPWLKYYSEEAYNHPLTEKSIYEYLVDANQNHLDDVALIYFGKKICFKELFEHIDQTAAAFRALGVKEKEIVTVALPSIPEGYFAAFFCDSVLCCGNRGRR